ncbi:MAG: response regulator transcription factor [Clostridia bacterium]|nr:response regulator transcription factor [Clostridia bacterium]
MNILVVEDEKPLSDGICEILRSQKYRCDPVYNGEDAVVYGESGIYDLILLDIMLPYRNGFDVLKILRSKKINTPILLLTARDDISEKVRGLDLGADDYLTKPFSRDELLARIRALTRRTGNIVLDTISYSDLVLDLNRYTLSCGDKSITLGHKEFEILKLLMANPTHVFSKEDLITKVWGYLSDAEDNNVEVYISFIRKKFVFLKSKVNIVTIRKIGYHLDSKGE